VTVYWSEKWPRFMEYGGRSQHLQKLPTAPYAETNKSDCRYCGIGCVSVQILRYWVCECADTVVLGA